MKKTYLGVCFNLSQTVIDGLGNEQETNTVWIPMIPAGEATGRDGRTWLNSNPDGIVEAFNAKLPFDLEHATEIKAPEGENADAYGWILALENRNGEIWAQVEWNHSGRWAIEDKRYLYYSPAFHYDSDGVITAMSSAGLTNKPNFYVPALNRQEDELMKLPKLICDALGLKEDATEQEATVAINSLKSERDVALNRQVTPDLNKYVPKETYDIALNRADVAEGKLADIASQEIEDLVQSAIDEGKVAPANKEMYVGLCRNEGGIEQFKSFIETALPIASNSEVKKPAMKQGDQKLEDHEVAICRKLNLSHEDFLKSQAEIQKRGA
ncbi:phage protease [Vibrio bivalvicida]|uniref:Phage protease n=1 Tax=Vibrio bivalvicida TaxID=1276888 RepID=A0ABV4MLI2_9VIBR